MDSQIYMLLAQAEQLKNVEYVKKAYKIINPDKKTTGDEKSGQNDIENFSQSLFVECAEKALSFNETEIANHCIQIYFSLPMIANQFLARAYVCQFELLAPVGTKQIENLEKSIPFLFKAIDFSKKNKRYNFLVYNASIIYWKYARNFVKNTYKRYLIHSLKKITESLKEINDNDYEWRVFLEKALIESYLDDHNSKEAINVAASLFMFIEKSLPTMFDEYFEFMIQKQLINDEEALGISSSKWDLEAIYRIEKLKMLERPTLRRPINKVSTLSVNASSTQLASNTEDVVLNELNEIYKIILPSSKFVQNKSQTYLQDLNKSKTDPSNKREDFMVSSKRQRLLLNLAHASLMFEEVNFCSQILGYLKETELVNAEEFLLELEFIECEQMVKELKHKQEKYTKNTVKTRNDCINKLHDLLRNAQRLNNPRLTQLGCMMQWNLCLPLLQPGLRKQTRKALQLVAECLETIYSMEWLLRCEIHFELAKCDEEMEQLQTAEQHLLKSFNFDDGDVYREQLNHALKRLRLRAELYQTPERVEDKVAMILEQCVVGGKSSEKRLKPAISELLNSLNPNKAKNQGGEINTHSLLLRAADLLAPNEFTHVLESETFKSNFGKANEDKISKLAKKALNYENSITKCVDHLNHRLIDVERKFLKENPTASQQELEQVLADDYKERLKLWLDLCRISRKQQLWDICRVSARFCLLYDDEKLIKRFLSEKPDQKSTEKEKSLLYETNKPVSMMQSTSKVNFNSLFDRELMRNLAEANFILGESSVQYIKNEGIELFDKPKIPDMTDPIHVKLNANKTQQESSRRVFATDKEWLDYCEWLNKLCHRAMKHFLRGVQIGIQLNESWLVCQGSTYAWNYMHHIFDQKKHVTVNNILSELVIALQKVGHSTEPELLVAVSVALSIGLMQNWLPAEHMKSLQVPTLPETNQDRDLKKKEKEKTMDKSMIGNKIFTITQEANADFKKALETCEYAMQVTNGENLIDVIGLKDRYPLIKTWILAKQMNQSQIKNVNFSKNSSQNEKIQDKYTKCMIGVEMHNRNLKMVGQAAFELKDLPAVQDLIALIDWADKWPDKLVELELWSNLAVLASKYNQTDNLRQCHSKALETISYFEKKKAENKVIYTTSQYLLSEACIALGEHLASLLYAPASSPTEKREKSSFSAKIQNDSSEKSSSASISKDMLVALRRDALNAFADAAGYAARAESYENAIHSSRHYWNLCMPYLQSNFERATLFENLREILLSLQIVYKFKPQEIIEEKEVIPEEKEIPEIVETKTEVDKKEDKKGKKAEVKLPKGSAKTVREPDVAATVVRATADIVDDTTKSVLGPSDAVKAATDDAFDDLTLRCVLYACMFQILIDKKDYEEALEQMEVALADLPRTKHRLLIYRLKVITKSKLGLDVQMDLQKFKEESEKNLAQMYRKVALESIKHIDTINSYQRAIEALSSDDSVWLKIEYILELAQWLYSHEYHLTDCIDLCEWAADLATFNIKQPIATARPVSVSTVSSTAVSKARRASKVQQTAGQFSAILPTIHDEGSTLDHSQIFRNVDVAFKNIVESEAKFESPSKEKSFDAVNVKQMNWNDLQDLKQLECLMRVNVILAQLIQPSSADYSSYLLKAYYSAVRLISLAIENSASANKDILATTTKALSEAPDKKIKDTASKKGNSTEPRSTVNTKVKDNKQITSSIISIVPQTIEQWSLFELTEEVATLWSQDQMKRTGINQHTIIEPNLTFYYLELLAKMLSEQGFSHLMFPVYNLQLVIINQVLKSELEGSNQIQLVSIQAYIRLKLINLCIELNLISSVSFQQQSLAAYILSYSKLKTEPTEPSLLNQASSSNPLILLKLLQIDPLEVVFIREQIYNQKQRMSQIEAEEEASLNANSSYSLGSTTRKINNDSSSVKAKKKNRAKSTKFDEGKDKSQGFNVIQDINLPGEHRNVYDSFQDMLYRDSWLLMAELLIQNGFFQTARDFLFEALNASTSFDDKITKAKIQYLLGQIALFDCNFIEARNFASIAQKTAIDEMHWFKSIMLLVDAHFQDKEDKESNEKCMQILNKSLNLTKSEKNRRQNKKTKFEYIEAFFNFKLAQIICDGILNGKIKDGGDLSSRQSKTGRRSVKRNTMHPNLFKKLSEVCNMYQKSIDLFLKNGYRRETLQIYKAHAKLLQKFALDCHNQEAKYDYMLQIYSVLNEACNIANEIWIEAESLQQINETQSLTLPIQRELVDLKLEISQLLTNMLEINLNEVIDSNEKNMNKDLIHKAVENFITLNDNLNKTELEWKRLSAQLPELIFVNLVSCHSLSPRLKHVRAQTLYLIGRTFRLIGELKFQLRKIELNEQSSSQCSYLTITCALSKWTPIVMDLLKEKYQQAVNQIESNRSKVKTTKSTINVTSAHTEVSESNTESNDQYNLDHLAPVFENSNLTNLIEQEQLKNLLISVNQTETQGMECLLQALNLSFIIEDKLLIRNISYELIEIIGRFDLSLCSQLIALYQSSSNAIEIEQIVEKSSIDPKNSLLVSYLHQVKFYQQMNVSYNTMNSPVVKQLLEGTKTKFNALKYLNVNSNHFNMTKDLPSNYLMIVLQHNHLRTELFGTVLNTSKDNPQISNLKVSQLQFIASSIANLKSSAIKIKTHPFELYHLQQQWKEWKSNLQAFNLKIEFQFSNDLLKKNNNENDNYSARGQQINELMKVYLNSGSPKFEEINRNMRELDNKFEFLINKTEAYLQQITEFFQGVLSSQEFQSQTSKPNTKLILLADLDLFEFPLESLKIFHDNVAISAISRDFSLQFFSTRFTTNKELEAMSSDLKANAPKGAKADKKPTQTAVISEQLSEGASVIDAGRFKYLVDVYLESSNNLPPEYALLNTFKKINQQYSQITTKWTGITGADHIAGLGECERLLQESSCLLFYGTERFLSYFNSAKISSFNLDCRLVISNDLAQTSKSFSRLGTRSLDEIECENTLESCVLLSLSGVKSIIANQWTSTLAENSNKLQYIFKEFVDSRQSCGELVRYGISPHLKMIAVDNEKKKEEDNSKIGGGTESKKDKKTSALRADTTTTKKTVSQLQTIQSAKVTNQANEEMNKKAEEDKLLEEKQKLEEDVKRAEMIKKAQVLRKEKSNMILYGLVDFYMVN